MNNQELRSLFKNSRLAQVATPMLKRIRATSAIPTHQVIFTPKSSSIRSQFGIKRALPKKMGDGYFAYNDIDNYKSMPDVEKSTGKMYQRLRFQEAGLALRSPFAQHNPLFKGASLAQKSDDTLLGAINLHNRLKLIDVKEVLGNNPAMFAKFKRYIVENCPQVLAGPAVSDAALRGIMTRFLLLLPDIARPVRDLKSLVKDPSTPNRMPKSIQGSAGLSYTQKGRLNNSPNGVSYDTIMPGRLVGRMEAAVGGFIAGVNDHKVGLLENYTLNYPGKHSRQFNMPFKVLHAELTESGSVRMQADAVKIGAWAEKRSHDFIDRSAFKASNPEFARASERANLDRLDRLLRIIG